MATASVTPNSNGNPFDDLVTQQPTPSPVQAQSNNNPFDDLVGTQAPTANQASISAYKPPTTTMGKLASWIDDVTTDLQDGGDRTGVGTVMQKLGARGLHNGNSAAVGDFMASLPLGLLKAGKGAAELIPSEIGGEKGTPLPVW